jgi:hypothetical protein
VGRNCASQQSKLTCATAAVKGSCSRAPASSTAIRRSRAAAASRVSAGESRHCAVSAGSTGTPTDSARERSAKYSDKPALFACVWAKVATSA